MVALVSYVDEYEDKVLVQIIFEGMQTKTLSKTGRNCF
jgi:hypothetical protein